MSVPSDKAQDKQPVDPAKAAESRPPKRATGDAATKAVAGPIAGAAAGITEFGQRLPEDVLNSQHRVQLEQVLEWLIAEGVIDEMDARKVRTERTKVRVELHPLVVIVNAKLENKLKPGKPLGLEYLTEWLAQKSGLDYVKIDPMKVDVAKVTQVISHGYASQYRILPIHVDEKKVIFATSEPFMTEWSEDLAHVLRRDLQRVMCNPLDVHRYLLEFFGLSRSVAKARDMREKGDSETAVLNFEQLLELGQSGKLGADDQHVVNIVDWLLQYAFEQRASDIHLEPRREMSNVRFRIDGVMHTVYQLPTPVMKAVTSRIKILGRMDVAEKRRPQDGRLKTLTPAGREIELRLSTMPTAFGEKCVMRIFDPDIVAKHFSELGFTDTETQKWKDLVERPNGIVLVTGPTGSGKTTTLYSTLRYLAKPELNVCTVEDPIEMVSPALNQMQVQHNIDLTFAAGVRTLLRQDPDIIMVGEVRDLETAEMAIQASLTGHLVLSTLHTNDAPSAITRLMDIGVPHYLIQATVVGIVAQRLVRTLCPHCKKAGTVSDEEWEAVVHPWKIPKPKRVAIPAGCLECRNTGYQGRTGIYEMMQIDRKLRSLIVPDLDTNGIRDQARKNGMRPLRISAGQQVARGLTTVEEVLKVIPAVME